MPKGGKREGAGRKKGQVNRISADAIEKAKATGELPHEFLLRISRGGDVDGTIPDFDQRTAAAIAAAPYFAPKLASVEQKHSGEIKNILSSEPLSPDDWDRKYSLGTTGRTSEGSS